MSRLHEKDEPFPWQKNVQARELLRLIGPRTDELLTLMFNREPHYGIIRCNGCGRWQDFPPPHTFDAMRARAAVDGWRRDGPDDLCPRCIS